MAEQEQTSPNESKVPLSIVFITIGGIILLTTLTIWLVAPATMPQPLYNIIGPLLPRTAAPEVVAPPVAAVPAQTNGNAATLDPTPTPILSLLPETPLNSDEATEYPDYFVSAEEAALNPRTAVVGQPQRIVIPAINLDAHVTDVGLETFNSGGQTFYQWSVPKARLGGWHNSSALLGETGNTVINGHHNVHGEVFRDLIDLETGDEIVVYDNAQAFTYRITAKEILEERGQPLETRISNAQWIEPTEDERITLVTCWPFTDNSHRVIVVAEPIEQTTTNSS